MKRDTAINILLIVAGVLLALALFWAGALWTGKKSSKSTGAGADEPVRIVAIVSTIEHKL